MHVIRTAIQSQADTNIKVTQLVISLFVEYQTNVEVTFP